MKGRAITLPKREANPQCEDASLLLPHRLLAVADGAGGGGLYADAWARYLLERLPRDTGFADADALDCWLGSIWEEFYNKYEHRAEEQGSWYLNKFYDEGSFSTLVALWRIEPRRYYWVAYGDSVAFHYSRRDKLLYHSFPALADFAKPPHLINCKDELHPEGFHSGYFDVMPGDYVLVASDALAQYLIMMSQLTRWQEYRHELTALLGQNSRQSDYLRRALTTPHKRLWQDILRPLLAAATMPKHFACFIDKLLSLGFIAPDDYSIVWHKC